MSASIVVSLLKERSIHSRGSMEESTKVFWIVHDDVEYVLHFACRHQQVIVKKQRRALAIYHLLPLHSFVLFRNFAATDLINVEDENIVTLEVVSGMSHCLAMILILLSAGGGLNMSFYKNCCQRFTFSSFAFPAAALGSPSPPSILFCFFSSFGIGFLLPPLCSVCISSAYQC